MSDEYNAGFAAGCLEQEGYEAELTRLRAERDALRSDLAAMTKRATDAEGYAEHLLTEARKTADVTAQAEAECDALRAEVARLTTLRPASEPGAEMRVLWHYKTTPTLSLERWTLREDDLIGWSPIPALKEAKNAP